MVVVVVLVGVVVAFAAVGVVDACMTAAVWVWGWLACCRMVSTAA